MKDQLLITTVTTGLQCGLSQISQTILDISVG